MLIAPRRTGQANPFPGLRSFERTDAHLFFGRGHQVQALRDKLAQGRFLAIIGASGSGKSSLVKAGLIPQLAGDGEAATPLAQAWRVAFCTPGAAPLTQLARALHTAFAGHPEAAALAEPGHPLPDAATLAAWCGQSRLLLFIDQFEELFRYQAGQNGHPEVTRFIALLLALSGTPGYPVYVVLTMRSDYLDACTAYLGLTEAINRGSYLLPKMSRADIEEAITTPITHMGAQLTPALTARLLADMDEQADQLPILQHALMRTWNHWQRQQAGRPLDEVDYEAIGTLERAISVHGEEIFTRLPNDKSRLAAEKLFKALIVLGTGDAGVVHPLPLAAISGLTGVAPTLLADVADQFRQPDVSFLTPLADVPATDQLIIDLGHERITVLWERLRTWVSEETDSAKFYRQLSHAATLYQAGKAGIWTNPELQIGLKWLADTTPTLAWANRYDHHLERAINFLQYSKKQFDFKTENNAQRRQRELKRTRAFALVLGVGALVSLLFLMVSVVLSTQARQSEEKARAKEKSALFERNRAESQTREAITQKKISDQQEAITRQQKQLTEEQRTLAVEAQQVAVTERRQAESAQHYAEAQRQNAVVAKEQAVLAKNDARKQEKLAKNNAQIAQDQKTKAVSARQDAEKQRSRAVARTVAIEATQLPDSTDAQLPLLLAQVAYRLNETSGGQANVDIFNALAKVSPATQATLRRHPDNVRTVALSTGGPPLLASGSDDGTVRVGPYAGTTLQTQVYKASRRVSDGIRALLFSPDGRQLYGGSEQGQIYVWDVARPQTAPLVIAAHHAPVHTLVWQPGPTPQLLSVSADSTVRSWRPRPGSGLDTMQRVHAPAGVALYCASFTPDGARLVCGANNRRIISFNARSLRAKPALYNRAEFAERVTALAFAPASQQLVTGNNRGLVYTWQVEHGGVPGRDGQLLPGGHTSTVSGLAFSPDGKQVASCSADWTIHLWNTAQLAARQPPLVLTDFGAWVMSLCFTPDGKRLIGASADRTVRVRTVSIPDLYQDLLRRLTRPLNHSEWEQYVDKDLPYSSVYAK
jgi:WD40 repeat protein/energy-coupling factor transporter ATP-binding protein EcfA2